MFESVSTHIAVEAHRRLMLEASVVPTLGPEYLANTASVTASSPLSCVVMGAIVTAVMRAL